MVLIIDNTRRKFRAPLRARFLDADIPCCVASLEQAVALLPASLVVVTEAYLIEDVRDLSALYCAAPVLLHESTDSLYDFVLEAITAHLGSLSEHDVARVSTREGNTYFFRQRILLTRTERRILNMLKFAPIDPATKAPVYYPAEQLAAFCMPRGAQAVGSIPVHIANINRKTICSVHLPIIENKRFHGYRIFQ